MVVSQGGLCVAHCGDLITDQLSSRDTFYMLGYISFRDTDTLGSALINGPRERVIAVLRVAGNAPSTIRQVDKVVGRG